MIKLKDSGDDDIVVALSTILTIITIVSLLIFNGFSKEKERLNSPFLYEISNNT